MNLRKSLLLLIKFIGLNAQFAMAQDLKLDLQQFLELAKGNDPQVQSIVAERLKAKYLMDLNLPSRKILLTVKSEYGFTRNEDSTNVLGATITKPLLESGTKLSIGKTLTERPDRDEDVTELRIEQSLYQNAFGGLIRRKKDNLRRQESIIELQVIEAYEDYVEQVTHKYLDLTLAYLNFKSAQRLNLESKELLANVRRRKKNSVASDTDVNRALLQSLQRDENVLQARVDLETQSIGVMRVLGSEESRVVIPQTDLNLVEKIGTAHDDIEHFLVSGRSRVIYDKQEAVSEENLALVKESLKPDAALLLGFNIDKSRRFNTKINREEAVIGIKIDFPFDDSLTKAQIKETSYHLLKSKIAKKSFEGAIRESISSIKNRILRQKEQLGLSKKKWELSRKIVKAEHARYKVGRITLENLIMDKNIEAQNEFAYLFELTRLNKLIIQWLSLTDQLIISSDINR